MSNQSSPVTPLEERVVAFYGDQIPAARILDDEIVIPLRPVADALGLAWGSQNNRLQRDEVLARRIRKVLMHGADGKLREMICLPIDLLPGWLFGVSTTRVRPELREKLSRYREECFKVLWEAFRPQILVAQSDAPQSDSHGLIQLQQIAEMGRAITAMAEQQIEIQRQQNHLAERLNKAGQVVRGLQGELQGLNADVGAIHVRLEVLEERLHPASYITETQAAEVSNVVKALAEFLTGKERAKNHYQGIFGELYRRFGVSSYKLIRVEQYAGVLEFLDRWRAAGSVEPPAPA
ncbi:MAG: phage antirepressor N-terminal domain-containing protein [Oscillochloridaceae bacterium umkhey_bin13]